MHSVFMFKKRLTPLKNNFLGTDAISFFLFIYVLPLTFSFIKLCSFHDVFSYLSCYSSFFLLPLSLSGHSDLDRDFWNNNDSSNVQQRWSSYPPKEFLLNMSPYAPYGDPRLTPKWVSVMAGKGPLSLSRAVKNRGLYAPWKTPTKLYE